jgi:2'-5' RNA ligase
LKADKPTSLIIPVNEAGFLQPFRRIHLHRPGATMPPHVTIQSPFLPAHAVDQQVIARLRRLCASHPQFDFTLATVGRFTKPGVFYLVPEPTADFRTLNRIVRTRFSIGVSREPVFHLTLAGWHPTELDRVEEAFRKEYGARLPILARVTEVCLYRRDGNVWVKCSRFPLL